MEHKELPEINKKSTNNIENGLGKGYYGEFMEEETHMNNKHRKICRLRISGRKPCFCAYFLVAKKINKPQVCFACVNEKCVGL